MLGTSNPVFINWEQPKSFRYQWTNLVPIPWTLESEKFRFKPHINYVTMDNWLSIWSCICIKIHFISVQLLNCVQLFATPWTPACQVSLSFTNSWTLFKLMSIESVILSTHLTLCCPLPLQSSIFPSIRVFSTELVLLIRWPEYCSFSFSIQWSQSFQWIFRTEFV